MLYVFGDYSLDPTHYELRQAGRPTDDDALSLADGCARGRLSKFQPCLPERLEAEYLASMLTDRAEAQDVVSDART